MYLISPSLSAPEITQLTETQVYNVSGSSVSAARDGSGLIFVDSDNYIRVIASDGSSEAVISSTGKWKSVALSPDGTRLAATSIYIDGSIYIFDFVNPENNKVVRLRRPTTGEGLSSGITLFADALEWNLTGDYLIYDAYNLVEQIDGPGISFWDICLMQVDDEVIIPVFTSAPGVNIGNPAFASTNDIIFALDITDDNSGTSYVAAFNLFTGYGYLLEENLGNLSYPDYSSDDTRIVFQRQVGGVNTIRQISVDSTKLQPVGYSVPWIEEGGLPTWFTIEQNCCQGLRGNANGDAEDKTNIGDVTYLINYLFGIPPGPEPVCREEGNANADVEDKINIADVTYLIDYLFGIPLGPAPPACP